MATSNNNRIFFAGHSLAIKTNGGALTFTTGHLAKGVQNAGITTNINLDPQFELGLLEIYENVEGIPDVELTAQKVLDGRAPLYLMGTTAAVDPTLNGRSNARADIGLAVYPDTNTFASGTPLSVMVVSGAYINSVGYNFVLDGSFTEDVSWVANDKIWTRAPGTATGTPNYGEVDLVTMPTITWNAHMNNRDVPSAQGGIARSEDFSWAVPTGTGITSDANGAVDHPDVSVLPTEIFGISRSGTNPTTVAGKFDAHISNISTSVSFNRETINELGRRGPYNRSITFPVEVTTQIGMTATEGDLTTQIEAGAFGSVGTGVCTADRTNVRNRTIRLVTCDGTRIYLGTKNKLSSVSYEGGDAGGGNVNVTYNYSTQNVFTVMHQNDPHASGAAWWAQRSTNGYLTE